LYSFRSVGRDAEQPDTLVEGTDGTLYGTAVGGDLGRGAIFKINKDGTGYRVFSLFELPTGGLVEANGVWYGTSSENPGSTTGAWSSRSIKMKTSRHRVSLTAEAINIHAD
jgi:uncharacterized repeat protein (TIGR03803 family)